MVQVEMSSATFERLQKAAVPLVDTIETVINRLLDQFNGGQTPASTASAAKPKALTFGPGTVPPLKHAKVVAITIDGVVVTRGVNWNGLLREVVRRLPASSMKPDALRGLVIVNFVVGRKEDEGYRYLPEADISLQGQDAADAAKAAFHIARQMGWALEVEFVWRIKPGAAHPGQMGVLKSR